MESKGSKAQAAAPPGDRAAPIDLAAVLPLAEVQGLLERFNRFFPAVTAILDLEGNILQAAGWQRICTEFHRVHPETCKGCKESDLFLAGHVRPGEFVAYRCKNQLWDVVTPLAIGGVHCGNLYTGQFLFDDEPFDEATYAAQAERHGFDREAYLAALREVPRIPRRRLDDVMRFLVELTSLISGLGLANARLQGEIAERRRLYAALEAEHDSRIALERGLLEAQRRESLGVLAGGVAHDFNNLLLAVSANLELARLDARAGSGQAECLDDAAAAVRRAAELTRQMLAYAGRGQFVIEPVRLGALVAQNEDLFRASIPRTVALVVDAGTDLAVVRADKAQLHQVVTNLLVNAAEAIGADGGTVVVRTGVSDLGAEALASTRLAEAPPPGRYAWIDVADTGCGMDDATLARAFEPFFTTKEPGRGLGLAAIHGVVTGLGGAIFVDTTPRRGTSVRVLLPATEPRVDDAARPAAGARGEGPSTVLVVDDEPPVRAALARMIRRLGHRVVQAADGHEAIGLVEAPGARFDCAIIDLTMPGMDGLALRAAIGRVAPALPTILSSGYDLEPAAARPEAGANGGFLRKPYSIAALEAALDAALAQRA